MLLTRCGKEFKRFEQLEVELKPLDCLVGPRTPMNADRTAHRRI